MRTVVKGKWGPWIGPSGVVGRYQDYLSFNQPYSSFCLRVIFQSCNGSALSSNVPVLLVHTPPHHPARFLIRYRKCFEMKRGLSLWKEEGGVWSTGDASVKGKGNAGMEEAIEAWNEDLAVCVCVEYVAYRATSNRRRRRRDSCLYWKRLSRIRSQRNGVPLLRARLSPDRWMRVSTLQLPGLGWQILNAKKKKYSPLNQRRTAEQKEKITFILATQNNSSGKLTKRNS